MQNLVYLGKVIEIRPIEGADKIEQAVVVCGQGGKWSGVVSKGQFAASHMAQVYLQDSIIPPSPELAFMEKHGWRVRMARFKGVPSECLITAPSVAGSIGQDVTAAVGVTKYEKPLPPNMTGEIAGNFPGWISKTDEPNFQAVPEMVEALFGQPFYATVKYDGSSATAWVKDGQLHVCSRNYELKDGNNTYWQAARTIGADKLPEGYAIQFEVYGEGIQKNPLGIKGVTGAVFNVWLDGEFLGYEDTADFCDSYGLPMVKLEKISHSFHLDDEQLRKLAEGTYPNGKQREGIVIRPIQATRLFTGDRLSFKVINLLYKD